MSTRRTLRIILGVTGAAAAIALVAVLADAVAPPKSISSTSQNRATPPAALVAEQLRKTLAGYQIVAANDLGMHCGNLDQRAVSILPPFNTVHAQVLRRGKLPVLLNKSQVKVVYSAASNPTDPTLASAIPSQVYKTNFWDRNPRTLNSYGYDAYNPQYPPGILKLFPLRPDMGLPVPDLQRLYLGDGKLVAGQQAMPSATAPPATKPYLVNIPQTFAAYYNTFPFFIKFPFGYTLSAVNFFSAEGIPAAPFDDKGRINAYPLMRVQAAAVAGNTLGLGAGTVIASVDAVTPVSAEVSCDGCHTSAIDGGNGSATDNKGFPVATRFSDPAFGQVPEPVSIAYAWALNVIRLHDKKHGTKLALSMPVQCQTCHYSPALDLAHLGPQGPGSALANGRQQTLHHSMSMAMHAFHGKLLKPGGIPLFPRMPSPAGRTIAVRDNILTQTCYQCHPGRVTKCFRGAMFDHGLACQDCHGSLTQIGTDFSKNVSPARPGAFIVAGDFYTNPATPRVPWANEPMCQSCHSGDAVKNLATSAGAVPAPDRIHLLQAYRTTDVNAKPIVAINRRFAENTSGIKQVLFRLSKGHGGVFCEGCHGSTHAEWPNRVGNANDNIAATQLQGHDGVLVECATCHGPNAFTVTDFVGNFDANGLMKGPHGMHPVNSPTGICITQWSSRTSAPRREPARHAMARRCKVRRWPGWPRTGLWSAMTPAGPDVWIPRSDRGSCCPRAPR